MCLSFLCEKIIKNKINQREYFNMKKSDFFYCYSINLLRILRDNGHSHIQKGTNPSTNRDFWVFIRTPSFLETLTKYKDTK